jgi:integrase/recombinase XerD
MKQIKLKPTKTSAGWSLNIPAAISPTGKRKRLFFSSRDKAEAFAAPLREKHHAGETATILPPQQARLAQHAFEILGDLPNEDIIQAVNAWKKTKTMRGQSVTMEKLFEEWQTEKIRKPKFLRRLAQLKNRCAGMLDILVCDLTAEDIETHALRDAAPSHRNQILRELRGMINHATRKLWREGVNPVLTIGKTDVRKSEAQIYSVDQIKALMRSAVEHCEIFVPSLALMIWAGIRPEIETLTIVWEEIDLEEGFVDVTADTAKRDRRRHIQIEPTLMKWLKWYIERNGPQTGRVCPWVGYRSIQRNRDRILKHAGLKHAPDVYRHTFASAHVAHFKDLTRIVSEMGHEGDPQLLWKHYFRRIKKPEAEEFWNLTPEAILQK